MEDKCEAHVRSALKRGEALGKPRLLCGLCDLAVKFKSFWYAWEESFLRSMRSLRLFRFLFIRVNLRSSAVVVLTLAFFCLRVLCDRSVL